MLRAPLDVLPSTSPPRGDPLNAFSASNAPANARAAKGALARALGLLLLVGAVTSGCTGALGGANGVDDGDGGSTPRADGQAPDARDGGIDGQVPQGDAGVDGMAPEPEPPLPELSPARRSGRRPVIAFVASESGVIDPVSTAYQYAPEFLLIGGRYHFWNCWGVSGDYVGHKSANWLSELPGIGLWPALTPINGENHTCDPSVVRGGDGNYYMHYSYLPDGYATWAGVAVANSPDGPWLRLGSTVGSQALNQLAPNQYGRGQTSVTRGHDGAYYMMFTNQIKPFEEHSIMILRSPDASFRSGVTEVARYNPGLIAGWSADITYDRELGKYLVLVPGNGTRINVISTGFDIEASIEVAGQWAHKESQSILANEYGEVTRPNGKFIIASGQPGPRDNDWATSPATGPMFWQAHDTRWTGHVATQGFEAPSHDGWESYAGANIVNYEDPKAFGGTRVLAFNAGAATGSIIRDYGIQMYAGNGWLATAMVKAETATASGRFCVWLLGQSANENGCTRYSVTNDKWIPVTAMVEATSAHNVVRTEFYPDAGTTRIDNARLEATISSQNFERGGTDGWTSIDGASFVNYEAPTAYDGGRLFAFHGGPSGNGSVSRDTSLAVLKGTSWSAVAMVRAESPTATGSLCVWLLGQTPNESHCEPYSVTDQGWTRVESVVSSTNAHDTIRVQFYPTAGVARIDNVALR
jgi:hypothetical protein